MNPSDHVLAPELEAEHTAVPIAADSRVVTPRAFPRYAPERLLDADFPHERAKARIWAEGVEERCRRDEQEPFGALLVGRLQPAQRLLVVPQAQLDECDAEGCVAGRAALERREDLPR